MNPENKNNGYLSPKAQEIKIKSRSLICMSGPNTTETKPGGMI